MAELDEELVNTIATAIGSLTKGTNLFMGPVEPPGNGVPDQAVFVLQDGGPQSTSYDDGGSGSDLKQISLQVMVRANAGRANFSAGQALAKSIRAAGHKASLTGALLFGCVAQESAPLYLGQDKKGHPEWSINYLVWKEE